MLRLERVSFSYVPESPIMTDVSFTLDAGEFVAIGGRNGCGKTTLTRLLVGLEQPTSGAVYINGEDVTKWSAAQRSAHIGYVFQQPDRQMFCATVYEEVAFGPKQAGLSEGDVAAVTEEALERVGLRDLRDAYPPLLRQGEKQRVAIASALAMRTKLLILDEPTSGQDGRQTKALMTLLDGLHKEGLCIALITHDMEIMAEYCTRAIIMGYGGKAFDGTPQELFTRRDDLQALGLTKPPAVALSERVPGLGYCKSMDELVARMKARVVREV